MNRREWYKHIRYFWPTAPASTAWILATINDGRKLGTMIYSGYFVYKPAEKKI
jgi:hypothetical protein